MDKAQRKLIQDATQEARRLLEREFSEQLESPYDIFADGTFAPEPGGHLDEAQRVLREKLVAAVTHRREKALKEGKVSKDDNPVAAYLREVAFTTLNRFVALKMLEARELVQECVSKGEQSAGFREFTGLAPGLITLPDHGYRLYLECLFEEVGREVRVLFDRRDDASLLWPRRQALTDLLAVLNDAKLAAVWDEDETIGWVYQYFNSQDERRKMRDESAAPQNSRELAVRNQFFTPRYVVEFLTDNTLGRTWVEMRAGETALVEKCKYLVRAKGDAEGTSFKDAVRPKKDPRELAVLDPASGSGHFLLYCFDLLETIYAEAYEDADLGARLKQDFPDAKEYRRQVPSLILEHNLYGIDIDMRAAQIAALALWLRAQGAYQSLGLRPAERPPIERINVVCAEPMPGERELLEEFVAELPEDVPGELVRQVFERMRLAGECGSLLRIEDDIREPIAEARRGWLEYQRRREEQVSRPQGVMGDWLEPAVVQNRLDFDYAAITDEKFFDRVEERVVEALRDYAARAGGAGNFSRYLFAADALQGFAFVDVCRKRFDMVLMNPPFGDASIPSKKYIDDTYADTKGDVYKAFVECFQDRLVPAGYLGIISSRTGFFLGQSEDWRTRVVLRLYRPIALADLGSNVLDAMVEVAAYVLRSLSEPEARDLTLSLVPVLEKVVRDKQDRFSLPKWQAARGDLKRHQAAAELERLEAHGFIERCPGDIIRYTPLWRAVKKVTAPPPPVYPPLICVRALADQDKGAEVLNAITRHSSDRMFCCDPGRFSVVPTSPFAYWVSERVQSLYQSLPRVESNGRYVKVGVQTFDDVRFVRATWETTLDRTVWVPFAKGGAYSPFYSDIHLVVNFADSGREASFFKYQHRPREGRQHRAADFYGRPGLTWPRRSQRGLALRVLPRGCIFSDKGPTAFLENDGETDLLALLGVINSAPFRGLVALQMAFGSFEVGVIQRTVIPHWNEEDKAELAKTVRQAWGAIRSSDVAEPTAHAFIMPAVLLSPGKTLADRTAIWAARVRTSEEAVAAIQADIDNLAFHLYGLDAADRAALIVPIATEATVNADAATDEDEEEEAAPADAPALTADLLAYALGCAFGRWDIRFTTGARHVPEPPDPFAPLPVCPPGMLQNEEGLPAGPEDVPDNYPLRISWPGILVDDPGHAEDTEARVREVLHIIWAEHADLIEQEACEILCIRSLREFFRKPNLFFADHLKRYSKSRRKAPIYWQLATPSASFSVWLYYHRFTTDTFYKVVNDYVKPKIDHEELRLARLRQEAGSEPTRSQRHDIEAQEAFVAELKTFREEAERIAPLWRPDLNDGVIINFAPLWRLVPQHKGWQKECKAVWDKLVGGDYDWSNLAMRLWPERVVPMCQKDMSLAIAHDLTEAFWQQDDDGKWRPKEVTPDVVERLVNERTSNAVKNALAALLEAPSPLTRATRRRAAETAALVKQPKDATDTKPRRRKRATQPPEPEPQLFDAEAQTSGASD